MTFKEKEDTTNSYWYIAYTQFGIWDYFVQNALKMQKKHRLMLAKHKILNFWGLQIGEKKCTDIFHLTLHL